MRVRFRVERQGSYVMMTNGEVNLMFHATIPSMPLRWVES